MGISLAKIQGEIGESLENRIINSITSALSGFTKQVNQRFDDLEGRSSGDPKVTKGPDNDESNVELEVDEIAQTYDPPYDINDEQGCDEDYIK
ncbi:hypothetical protein ACLOJK_003749 [Asimina triloba]